MVIANLFGVFEGPELLIILAVVLLLFGGAKLPELARSLGHAKREFHDAIKEPAADMSSEPAPTPAALSENGSAVDSVTVSRAELERLRAAAAQAHPHTPS